MRQQKNRAVTNEERELVLEICEGLSELIHLIGHIRIICDDAQDMDYMDILRWFKRQNLKGWNLRSWMLDKHDGSILRAIAFARKQVHSDFAVKRIFAKPI